MLKGVLVLLALLSMQVSAAPASQGSCASVSNVTLNSFFGIFEPLRRQCDSDDDCPGFANHCFAGRCTSDDDSLCDSDDDCPGFANHCFAGHCTSSDTNQCDSDDDCPGFANHCFAGHCTNP